MEGRNGSHHILSPPSWFIYSEKVGGYGVEMCVCVRERENQIAFFGYISHKMIKEL